MAFAAELREELNIADIDFETRRGLIELLDAKVTLTAKDDKREALAECVLARQVLSIASRTTSGMKRNEQLGVILSARLIINPSDPALAEELFANVAGLVAPISTTA